LSSIINGHAETDWQRSAPAEAGGKTLQAGHSPSSLPITAPDTALSTAHLRPSHTEHHLHHCQNTEKEPNSSKTAGGAQVSSSEPAVTTVFHS